MQSRLGILHYDNNVDICIYPLQSKKKTNTIPTNTIPTNTIPVNSVVTRVVATSAFELVEPC